MGNKRSGRGAAIHWLQNRSFHFKIPAIIHEIPHRLYHVRALSKRIAHFRIHNQINIALAVAQFFVCKRIIRNLFSLFIFHFFWDWNRAYGFCEKFKFLGMNGGFAGSGFKNKAFNAYNITDIH